MYGIETIKKLNERAAVIAKDNTDLQRLGGDSSRLASSSQAEIPQVTEVTSKSWKGEVLDSPVPVVVDFYTDWCGPCDYVKPIVDQLANEFEDTAKFAKLDVEKNWDIANEYNVRSIPTLAIFRSGKKLAATVVGAASKEEVHKFVKEHIRT